MSDFHQYTLIIVEKSRLQMFICNEIFLSISPVVLQQTGGEMLAEKRAQNELGFGFEIIR